MSFGHGNVLMRLDTIAYLLAVFTLIPLFFNDKKYIIYYTIPNIVVLFIFTRVYLNEFGVNEYIIWDYFADNTFAIIFLAIVSYNIIRIHKLTIDRANFEIKERKTAEHALSASEVKYKETIDLLPQVVFETDLQGNLIYVNKNAYSVFGYSEEDLKNGFNYLNVISHQDKQRVIENFKKVIAGEPLRGNEYNAIKKNGTVFPVQIYSSVVKAGNKANGVRGLIIDMTETKKAEQAILESEQLRSRIFDCSMIPIAILDIKTLNYVEINQAAIKIHGFESREEMLKKSPINVSPEFQYDGKNSELKAMEYINQAIKEGSVVFEWLHKRPNGELWDAEVQLLYFQSGNNDYIQASLIDITERKKAEEALKKSEELYRKLLVTVPDLIIRTDLEGNITFINEFSFPMLNFLPRERFFGRNIFSFISEKDKKRALDNTGLMFEIRLGPQEYELTIDEFNIICEVNGDVLYDTNEKPTGMVYVIRDITERRKNENSLRDSEERYRTIIENMVEGILLLDEKGCVSEWNDSQARITGYSKQEILGKKWLDIVKLFIVPQRMSIDILNRFADTLNIALETGDSPIFGKALEFPMITKNGKQIFLQQILFSIKTMNGYRIGSVNRDITEIKQAEMALEESEEQYRLLFESANDAIFLMDESKFINCNQKTLDMFGCEYSQIIGVTPDVFSPEKQPDGSKSAEKALDKINAAYSGEPQFFEWIHKKANGEEFNAEVSLNKIEIKSKIMLQAIVRDITERKKAEEELRLSEEKFALTFRTSPDSLTLTNLESGILEDVNSGFENIFGYKREEVVGKKTTEFGLWVNISDREYIIDSIRNNRNITEMEALGRRRSGEIMIGLVSAEIIKTGNKSLILTIVRDITEKKKAEEALRQSEERFSLTFRTSPDSMILTRLSNGELVDVNLGCERVFGYQSEELIGKNILDLNIWADPQDRINAIRKLQKDGFVRDMEAIYRRKSGELFNGLVSAVLFKMGNEEYILTVVKDITESKKAQEALRDSEEKFRSIVQGLTDMIIIINKQGLIEYLSPSVFKSIGYSEIDMIGKNPLEFVHKDDQTEIGEELSRVFNDTNRGTISLYRVLHKNGNYVYFESVGKNMLENKYVNGIVLFARDVTERIKAESALRESEQRFRNLVNNVPEPILIISFDGKIQYANPASNKFVGLDDTVSLVGMTFTDFMNSEQAEIAFNDLMELEQTSEPQYKDYQIKSISGEIKWVSVTGIKIKYEKYDADLVSLTDITERKLFENELIESEERARLQKTAITELALDESLIREDLFDGYRKLCKVVSNVIMVEQTSIWLFSDDGSELRCLTKYIASEDRFTQGDVLFAENYPIYFEALKSDSIINANDVLTDPRTFELKDNYLMSNGILSLLDSVVQIEGKIIGVFCLEQKAQQRKWTPDEQAFVSTISALISQWITNAARKSAENEIRILSKAIEQNPVAVIITDPNGNIKYINPKFTEITGYDQEEVIGQKPSILKSGKYDNRFYENLWATILSGKNWSGEFYNRKKNGDYYWESAIISPIFNEKHEITHFVAVKEDITEKKILYDEILIAKNRAEESDRLKTAFLQNMSHEIRTPLNGIIGFSSLLNEDDVSKEEIQYYTTIIQSSGKRLIEIVNNVLEISKIETGQISVDKKLFSINSLIRDLFSFFSPQAAAKNLKLNYHNYLDDDKSNIYSDDVKIHQILLNLLINALKFTKSGSINFGYQQEPGCIKFYVTDTGIGIPSEKHKRIFERFIQADISASREYEGAGLGLAICKGLVELLHGNIWLDSVPNVGTSFYFTIPVESDINLVPLKTLPDENIHKNETGNVLIVEDDYTSIEYYKSVLKNQNLNIIHKENGLEALEYLKDNNVDIVLMDIRMPVMDGFEAIPKIKFIKPELPIIAQTAYAFIEEKERILALGCVDYLSKPVQKEKLIELITKYTK